MHIVMDNYGTPKVVRFATGLRDIHATMSTSHQQAEVGSTWSDGYSPSLQSDACDGGCHTTVKSLEESHARLLGAYSGRR